MRKIVFGAGGTAGHVFMARGIAAHSKAYRILMTDQRAAKYCCDCTSCIHTGGSDPCPIFDEVVVLPIRYANNVRDVARAFWHAFRYIRRCKPSLFFGCGAYTSLIGGIAALLNMVDVDIYQGDQVVGKANRILQWFCRKSWASSENLPLRNAITVGCISRREIKYIPMENNGTFRILVMGSSVGSSLLSDILPKAVGMLDPYLRQKLQIVHQIQPQAPRGSYEDVDHTIQPFIDAQTHLPQAHLVFGRAGWSLISDIIASRRAAILIPWQGAAANHQYYNARWFSPEMEWVMLEHECTPESIAHRISDLANDMFMSNRNTDLVTMGKIANRAKYDGFNANAGKIIAELI